MTWLRLDDNFAQHPKVAALTDKEFRHWIRLLCWCAKFKTGGDVPDYALRELGVQAKVTAGFVELGLLDLEDDHLSVHDWPAFNPPNNADRQKRYRSRKQDVTGDVTRDVTSNTTLAGAREPVPVPEKTEPSLAKRDELWDALAVELGEPQTVSERGARNKALKELRAVGATPGDVKTKARAYRKLWPGMTLTANALTKHWTTLETPTESSVRCPECDITLAGVRTLVAHRANVHGVLGAVA